MRRRMQILVGIMAILGLLLISFGGYKYGLKQCKPCPQPVVKKEAVKKPQKAVKPVAKQVVVAPAPVPAHQVAVPNYGATKLILRIVVVEWSPDFMGKSLMSRDIGPVVRRGLANGTVIRTKEQFGFLVNGASVVVHDGSAIVDPGPIKPEMTLTVQPINEARFASPPNGLPLVTNPGELNTLVQQGISEIWMNFILAPAAKPAIGSPKGGSRPNLCFLLNKKHRLGKVETYEIF